ncbi:unnamed protein product [Diamesa serratosioi]
MCSCDSYCSSSCHLHSHSYSHSHKCCTGLLSCSCASCLTCKYKTCYGKCHRCGLYHHRHHHSHSHHSHSHHHSCYETLGSCYSYCCI